LEKLYAAARALAVLVAIIAAFVELPYAVVILLVLGGLSAVDEDNVKTYLIAIVLAIGAQALNAIPAVGTQLAAIFAGIGTAAIGGSIVAVTLTLIMRIKSDWVK